jgi:hypothetical protein
MRTAKMTAVIATIPIMYRLSLMIETFLVDNNGSLGIGNDEDTQLMLMSLLEG